jgi:hypothetical protein
VPNAGPTANAPGRSSVPRVSNRSSAVTSSLGLAAISAAAPSCGRAPSSPANWSAKVAAASGDRTMPLTGLCEMARAKRPLACGTASSVATACAPALSPKIVTLSGSPPNTSTLSRTQRSAITRSRRYRLPSIGFSGVDSDDRSMQPSAPSR